MEVEMEKMIKDKEYNLNMAIVPLDAIPISQLPSTGETIATTSSTQTVSAEQVKNTLYNISLHPKEIETLQG